MNASLEATVADVTVESEYRGTVYERTVTLEVGSSTIDCYDDYGYVNEGDCGSLVDVSLLGQVTNFCPTSSSIERSIHQPNQLGEDQSKWHFSLTGEIVCKGGECSKYPIIDIGVGTVFIVPTEEINEGLRDGSLNIGDKVQIEGGRLDILQINRRVG